jgi:hypothetical protein
MKNAVAICCLNSAAMLDFPLFVGGAPDQFARIEKSQRDQAKLLRGAAEIAEELLAALYHAQDAIQFRCPEFEAMGLGGKKTLDIINEAISNATVTESGWTE